jgi:hypothetical protein
MVMVLVLVLLVASITTIRGTAMLFGPHLFHVL